MKLARGACSACLVIAACASARDTPSTPTPLTSALGSHASAEEREDVAVDVTVEEEPDTDSWSVTYRFARPVMGAMFVRGNPRFRAASWKVEADAGKVAVAWAVHSNRDAVLTPGEKPFRELVLRFRTDAENKPSDYLVNAAFGDGSRLFYTGHFAVYPIECEDAPCTTAATDVRKIGWGQTQWHFRTRGGREVQVLQERAKERLDWRSGTVETPQGTYVYFGNLPPRTTSFGTIIVDPALPKWMAAEAERTIPKILEWLENDTHTKLTARPLVFVSAGGPPTKGRSNKGGVLPGVMQLAAWGNGWVTESAESRVGWIRFLAHELFHLWNGDMYRRRDEKDAWLSEGSSDYFSYRVLRALGVVDEAQFDKLIVTAANHCLLALRGKPLLGVRMDVPEYACGATLHAWTDGIAKKHSKTIGDVFGAMFTSAKDAGERQYGTDDMLRQIELVAGSSAAVANHRKVLLEGTPEKADELFAAALGEAGVPVDLVDPPSATYETYRFVTDVGLELSRCDCDSRRVSFDTADDGIAFDPIDECAALRGVRVVAVGPFDLQKRAAAAFGALLKRDASRPIDLGLEGGKKLALKCREDATLPPYKKLLRVR